VQGLKKVALHAPSTDWIPTLNGTPTPPRRRVLSPIEEAVVVRQTQQWLDRDVIERIKPPLLCNNLVLAAKKDGTQRVCVDCTPANKVTEDVDWNTPRLQDLRHTVKGYRKFTRLDLKDAFNRFGIPPAYRYLTAYRAGGQYYWFKRMIWGLKTAPILFQRYMDILLAPFREWVFCYMDDILIMADTLAELIVREREVIRTLTSNQNEVNFDKSEFHKESLLFAGLWISAEGIGPNQEKVAELLAIQPPTTKEGVRSALGLVSYLRDFIPLTSHFTWMLNPSEKGPFLTPSELSFHWTRLMRHLCAAITTNRHFKERVPADLYTDSSSHATGALIIQEGRVVALVSRKLSPAETRYSATDREHLGLVFAAKKLRLFLHQRKTPVSIYTDHSALLGRNLAEMSPRQCRWALIVRQWMPNVKHVPGKNNPADYISRWGVEIQGGQILA
jgi:RNase H-like domain found in reverse transcriptase/Reverse transcriptase (RNA-dependent DNA polymerase)